MRFNGNRPARLQALSRRPSGPTPSPDDPDGDAPGSSTLDLVTAVLAMGRSCERCRQQALAMGGEPV